jgi:predicted transcriptional regulator with HTH domain
MNVTGLAQRYNSKHCAVRAGLIEMAVRDVTDYLRTDELIQEARSVVGNPVEACLCLC